MTSITNKQIEHVAKLSNLPLTKTESKKLESLLSETIDYIKVLNELDTSKVTETYQVNNLVNVYQQENKNTTTLTQKQSLQNANKVQDGLFVSKGVFSEQ